jgi:hypothetical protein
VNRLALSEGVFFYVLGLVIIATHASRFWLGFSLAVIPPVVGVLGRTLGARGRRNW